MLEGWSAGYTNHALQPCTQVERCQSLVLGSTERFFALRLPIGRPAPGHHVVLHRVAANSELAGNPFAIPTPAR
jgi:hypothetical protein